MRVKFATAVAAVSTLSCVFGALPASATPCQGFRNTLEQEFSVSGPIAGLRCTVAAKVGVEPKDECESFLCVLISDRPNGPVLEAEVLSLCGDVISDSVVEGPNVLDGTVDGSVSACIGGAQLGPGVLNEGKIKLNCAEGDVKTKGAFEYQCTLED